VTAPDQLHKDRPTSPGAFFNPPAGLRNHHLQSVASRVPWRRQGVRHRAADLLAASVPEILDAGNGVRLLGCHSVQTRASRGLVVLMHGWEGSADSHYLLSAGTALYEAGFDVFRLNFRDHGNTQALNEDLFHSCRIHEVVQAVRCVQLRYPGQRLALVGHSLGGNFAVRVALEAPNAGLVLERVLAVCPVLKPHSTMAALERGLWIYREYFLRRWRGSLMRKAALFPDRYRFGNLARFRTLTETTDFFVRQYTEYEDLDSYLHGYALVGRPLQDLSIPTRLILAEDDPVIPSADAAQLETSDLLTIDMTRHGGHCGFIDDLRLSSWVDPEIVRDLVRFL